MLGCLGRRFRNNQIFPTYTPPLTCLACPHSYNGVGLSPGPAAREGGVLKSTRPLGMQQTPLSGPLGWGGPRGHKHHEPPHQFQAWQLCPRRGLSGPRDPTRGHARWIRRPEPGEPTQRRPLHSPLLSAWTLLHHVATRVRSVRSYLKLCTINFFFICCHIVALYNVNVFVFFGFL